MLKKTTIFTSFWRISFIFFSLIFFLFLTVYSANGAEVTLTWDRNPEPDVTGYNIYYGCNSGDYPYVVDAGNFTSCTISNLEEGNTYYFAAKAYNSSGNESDFSNEVSYVATLESTNSSPVADAGPDQPVNEGSIVTLNGSGSIDQDGDIASYCWTQTGGISVTLSDSTAIRPTFTAPDVNIDGGILTFELTVMDSEGLQSRDTCDVTIAWLNEPPVADAGPDQSVNEGSVVTLNGSGSIDPDGGITSYYWTQTRGISVTLSDSRAIRPTFTAPDVNIDGGILTFELTVMDNTGLQAMDTCSANIISVDDNSSSNPTDPTDPTDPADPADPVDPANPASDGVVFAVNAGGPEYVDPDGIIYQEDIGHASGGNSWERVIPIAATEQDVLYQTERYGDFSYNVPLPNGNYLITLQFAEIYWDANDDRVFDVQVEGAEALNDLDIFAEVGNAAAFDVVISASVTDEILNLSFYTDVDNAKISAILVENDECDADPIFAVNAGGPTYVGLDGVVYKADNQHSGGTAWEMNKSSQISSTADDVLYQTERYGDFSYNIPVTNGDYLITLKLAEIYWQGSGKRVFDVKIEGREEIFNLDICEEIENDTAYDIVIPVNVSDNVLNVNFYTDRDNAKVSAILVE